MLSSIHISYFWKKVFFLLLFFFILVLATYLRVVDLANNPPGFFVDEATHGLDAHSIWHTGKDIFGHFMPILFEEAGEFRSPLWIYISSPIVGVLGRTILSVRLASAIQGIISVVIAYLIGKKILHLSVWGGICSAAFLAFSPWHVFISRVGFEIVTYVMSALFLVYILLTASESVDRVKETCRKNNLRSAHLIILSLGFICSFFSYTVARFMLPLLVILFLISYPGFVMRLIKSWRAWAILIFTGLVLISLIVFHSPKDSFFKRWYQVRPEKIEFSRIIQGYKNHFSRDFLFTKGDVEFPGQYIYRHSYFGTGQMYYFQIPLILIGIIYGIFDRKLRNFTIFLLLIALFYPLGSVIVTDLPHANRSAIGIIPVVFLSANGLYYFFYERNVNGGKSKKMNIKWMKVTINLSKKIIGSIFVMYMLINLWNLLPVIHAYKKNVKAASWDGWQYGFYESLISLNRHSSNYDELIITHRFSSNHFLYKFFDVAKLCPKCRGSENPVRIDLNKKQLFALRKDDLNEIKINYASMEAKLVEEIKTPYSQGDNTPMILKIVRFEKKR